MFSDSLENKPTIRNALLKINLEPNAKPIKVNTARTTPLHLRDSASHELNKMLDHGIIERVPANEVTTWCHRGLWVPKKDGSSRLCVDLRQLNLASLRSPKPIPSTKDILSNLDPKLKVFAIVDCVAGYHQIEIAKESRNYTTFILESGRYRFLRSPMGLNTSGDAFCEATDRAFEHREGTVKLVDDGLTGAKDLTQLRDRMRELLNSCREYNIILSKKKFTIGIRVKFAGHIVGYDGTKPDPEKIQAIQDFPSPKSITEVRSFMGLANQLGSFIPDLAQMAQPIQALTKKETPFLWSADQEAAFKLIKDKLTSKLICKPFDVDNPNLRTVLYTDASGLGLGYILVQEEIIDNEVINLRLIRCGSRTLQPAEKNYAPTELEGLAIYYAATHCDHYLMGCKKIIVRTDHRALLGMWQKDLSEVPNKRIQRFRERLQHYNLYLEYIQGKKNCMADALSRYPLTNQEDISKAQEQDEAFQQDAYLLFVSFSALADMDPNYHAYLDDKDAQYKKLIIAIQDKEVTKAPQDFRPVFDHLSLIGLPGKELVFHNTTRLVIPRPARARCIKALHAGHCGYAKTISLANRLVYWPGMQNDIRNAIETCAACRRKSPKLQREKANKEHRRHISHMHPMSDVGVDLFEAAGRHYLIMVDRYSGFPFIHKLNSLSTTAITNKMQSWMYLEGTPLRLRSDGGPQFRGPFQDWCQTMGITHELASPYNPESNGLAEAAVKNVKHLLLKCIEEEENFEEALATWRSTPKADGPSPAALFRHREIRLPAQDLPSHPDCLKFYTTAQIKEFENQRQAQFTETERRTNDKGRNLPPIESGTLVDVYDIKKGWLLSAATVQHMREDEKSFVLKDMLTSRLFVRARKHLRASKEDIFSSPSQSAINSSPPAMNTRSRKKAERQSLRKKKVRFLVRGETEDCNNSRDPSPPEASCVRLLDYRSQEITSEEVTSTLRDLCTLSSSSSHSSYYAAFAGTLSPSAEQEDFTPGHIQGQLQGHTREQRQGQQYGQELVPGPDLDRLEDEILLEELPTPVAKEAAKRVEEPKGKEEEVPLDLTRPAAAAAPPAAAATPAAAAAKAAAAPRTVSFRPWERPTTSAAPVAATTPFKKPPPPAAAVTGTRPRVKAIPGRVAAERAIPFNPREEATLLTDSRLGFSRGSISMARGGPEERKKVLPPPPRRPIPPVQARPSPPRYSRGQGRGIRRLTVDGGLRPGVAAQAQSALLRALARLPTQVDWRPTMVPLTSAIPNQQLGQEVMAGTYTWGVSPHLARVPTKYAPTRTTSAPPSRVSRWPSEHTLARATRVRGRAPSAPALQPTQWARWPPAEPPRSANLNPGTASRRQESPSPERPWQPRPSSSRPTSATERPQPGPGAGPVMRPVGPIINITPGLYGTQSSEDIRVGLHLPGPHPRQPQPRGASLPRQW